MRHAARNCSPIVWLLALTLAAPSAARAQQPAPAPDLRARLESIYSAANQAMRDLDFVAAADRYAEALALLPETHANHESRALALLDSIAARREAHARTRDPLQLCLARDLLRRYLLTSRATYGTSSSELDGPRQAGRIHGEIEAQIAGLQTASAGKDMAFETCPGDQPKTAPAPAPAPAEPARPPPSPRRDPRFVAGITLLGVAGGSLALMGLGLGLGNAADDHGRDAHMAVPAPDIDALLADGFYQRGQSANHLAIAGTVLAGAALTAGAALLVSARVRPRRVALGTRGLGLGLRF